MTELYIDIEIYVIKRIYDSRGAFLREEPERRNARLYWRPAKFRTGGIFITKDESYYLDGSAIFSIVDQANPWFDYLHNVFVRFIGVKKWEWVLN